MPEQPMTSLPFVDPAFARGAQLDADTVVIDLTGPQPVVETRAPLVVDLRDRVARRPRDGRWALVAMLAALNVLDVLTTHLVLSSGGTEGNPIMAAIVTEGWATPLALKLGVCGAIGGMVACCPDSSRLVTRGLTVVTGIYAAIIAWNLAVLLALL